MSVPEGNYEANPNLVNKDRAGKVYKTEQSIMENENFIVEINDSACIMAIYNKSKKRGFNLIDYSTAMKEFGG